jgi:uncharacterized protein YutE (UPF0331/DUF86 family)
MESLGRIVKHLPNITLDPRSRITVDESGHIWTTDDTTLVILKGHLLIEAELIDICGRLLASPQALTDEKLGFYSRLNLVRALLDDDAVPDSIWQALKLLNRIRNKLAHNLESEGINSLIQEFFDNLYEFDDFKSVNDTAENINKRLVGCMVFLCGSLSSIGKPGADQVIGDSL